jgi:hypothetical protein
MADGETPGRGASRGARFALGKFRLPPLPARLSTYPLSTLMLKA